MEMAGHRRAWFACPQPRRGAKVRLYCFPYAGQGASVFRGWSSLLPSTIELWVARLPGREQRISEQPYANLDSLVSAACEELGADLEVPFAFFGHSMGALVAFELARRLRRYRWQLPSCLVVSAHRAPHLKDLRPPLADLPDGEFIGAMRGLNGTPPELFEHPELVDLMLPLLRADFKAVESYVHLSEQPLPCPIAAYVATDDSEVPSEQVAPWRVHTTGHYRMRVFPGNHFYLRDEMELLVPVLAQDVLDCVDGLATASG